MTERLPNNLLFIEVVVSQSSPDSLTLQKNVENETQPVCCHDLVIAAPSSDKSRGFARAHLAFDATG